MQGQAPPPRVAPRRTRRYRSVLTERCGGIGVPTTRRASSRITPRPRRPRQNAPCRAASRWHDAGCGDQKFMLTRNPPTTPLLSLMPFALRMYCRFGISDSAGVMANW